MKVRSSRTSFSPCDPTTIISSSSSSASSSWKMLIVSFCCSACSHSGATEPRKPVISGLASVSTASSGTAMASDCTAELVGRNHVVWVAAPAVPLRYPGQSCSPIDSCLRVSPNAGFRCCRKSTAFCSPPSLSAKATRAPNSRRRRTMSHCFNGRERPVRNPFTSPSVASAVSLAYGCGTMGFSSYTAVAASSSSASAAASAASAAAAASSAARASSSRRARSLSNVAFERQMTQFSP
mmetsp:Transcript_73959/g.178908  ORF Transcript_73959/g.178908 Transcript_73959/m.178908 type:complete len:238 (-) Transcript_73959:351-1064(-)